MQRENELEDEVEKYDKLEKQWNERREKMEAKIDALSTKVQELEALIASNETKVSALPNSRLCYIICLW